MTEQPSIIFTGDFVTFVPEGKTSLTGDVSNALKPDAADPIWADYSLGRINGLVTPKRETTPYEIYTPNYSGLLEPGAVLRTKQKLTAEFTTVEISRTALAAFYKTPIIETADTTFYPLSQQGISGWLKVARYQDGSTWLVEDMWGDLDCQEFTVQSDNVLMPKFLFTRLQANPTTLNAVGI